MSDYYGCRIWMQCKRIVAFYDSSLFLCIVGKRFCGYTVHMETKKTTQFKQKGGFLLCIIQQELMKHLPSISSTPENEIILDILPNANNFIPEDLVMRIFLFNFSEESTKTLSFRVPIP